MKPLDFAKALGVAIALMLLDLGAAFAAVWGYSLLIEPGHDRAYYVAAAPKISTWCTAIVGPILWVVAMWLLARRRPQRNAMLFALIAVVIYLALDWGSVAFKGILQPASLVILALKTFAALAGAWLGSRRDNTQALASSSE